MNYLGNFAMDEIVYMMFSTNDKDGGRVAPSSAFEVADIRVYKNGTGTKRSSEAGYTMNSPFDSMVGIHLCSVDTGDNTDAGFFAAGNDYTVILYPDETVDSESVSKVLFRFSIENRYEKDDSGAIADAVWDELVTDHTTANSFGAKMKELLYPDNAVYVSSVEGSAGTTSYVNGTVLNPVTTIADAKTIADALNIDKFRIVGPLTTLTLAADMAGYSFIGDSHQTLDLSTYNIEDSYFENLTLEGNPTVDTGGKRFRAYNCRLESGMNIPRISCWDCLLEDGLVLTDTDIYEFVNCKDARATAEDVQLDFGAAVGATQVVMSDFSGFIEIKNMLAGDVLRISGDGKLTFNANCTSGTASIGPGFQINDNSAGTTINILEEAGDWTSAEKEQLRHRLNIDGTQTAPSVEGGGAGKVAGPNADLTLNSATINRTDAGNAVSMQASDGHGLDCKGNGSGAGIQAEAGATGSGFVAKGGATSGHGISASAQAGNGYGMQLSGNGSGFGLRINGGATGNAVEIRGGTTSGRGIQIQTTDGHGIYVYGQGTNQNGLDLNGGAGGKDLKADEIDSILGDTNELQTNQGNWLTATGFSTHAAADVWSVGTRTLTSFGTLITDIWHHLLTGITTAGSIGKLIKDYLDAAVSTRATPAQVGTELTNYATNGVASQDSVDAIGNNTRFEFSTGKYYLKPSSSFNVYKIVVNLKDTNGNMEDPDNNDMALDLDLADATDKNAILYKEYALTNPLDATGISGLTTSHKKLVKIGTGRYEAYIKVDSADSDFPDQLIYNFAYEESSTLNYNNKSVQVFDVAPGTSVLSDTDSNKIVIAKAIRDYDADTGIGGTPSTGSIEEAIQDNIDDIGVTTPVGSNVTQIDGQATNGYNATLKLKQLDIQNGNGSALVAISNGNGHGMHIAGNGSYDGMRIESGAMGHGIRTEGGTGGGSGIFAKADPTNSGNGIQAAAGTNGSGMACTGLGTGDGLRLIKGGSGKDINADEIDQILADTDELQTNQGNWLTATGFSTHAAADVWAVGTRTLTSFGTLIADMWHHLLTGITTAGSIGKLIKDYLDAAVSTRATPAQVNTECDTALADYDGPTKAEMDAGFAGQNDLSAAQVNAEVDQALADYDGPTHAEMTAEHVVLESEHAALAAQNTAIEGDTQDIQSRIPAALVGGRMDSNVSAINNQAASAVTLQKAVDATETGTVSTGTHTTTLLATTSLTGLTVDAVKYRVVNFTSGNNKGRSAPITGYASGNGEITLDSNYPLPATPVNGDKFTIT